MTLKDEDKKIIQSITETVFSDLEKILKKLNKRFNLKVYSAILDEKNQCQYCFSTRYALLRKVKKYLVKHEDLGQMKSIFEELNIGAGLTELFEGEVTTITKNIKNFLDIRENIRKHETNSSINDFSELELAKEEISTTKESSIDLEQLLFCGSFELENNGYTGLYMIEIRNVDKGTINTFYDNPSYSYLRMVLENFFLDYYQLENNKLLIKDGSIHRKYNEDATTFVRRMARVFFGKIQSLLMRDDTKSEMEDIRNASYATFDNVKKIFHQPIDNLYYTLNLLEEIEDISNKTQEGASPFGSILFLHKGFSTKKIKYALKFREENNNTFKLSDSQKIRKLLEISNCEKELYLIANDREILGLGEVMWGELKEDDLLIRLDFKGLSKYNLVYVYTKLAKSTTGEIVIEDNKKVYKSKRNYEIVEDNLIAMTFKNPKIKEVDYSAEKFKRILQSVFSLENNNTLEKLEKVVSKAKEQKHGTMVVITKPDTARNELEKLCTQSTLVEPSEIDDNYIKFLTAIDGAVYYDTEGKCHAIGVILDGIAVKGIGDSSRGARYNSAHKYLEKLNGSKEKKEGCVIAIISEDGMVDIMPDIDNVDNIDNKDMMQVSVRNIVEEIIYLINEEFSEEDEEERKKKKEERLSYEKELKTYQAVQYDLYFRIAEEFYDQKQYKDSCKYWKKGFESAGYNSVISSYHYNLYGNCFHYQRKYEEAIELYEKAILFNRDDLRKNITSYGNIGSSYYGWGQSIRKCKGHKNDFKDKFEKSLYNLKEAIKIGEENGLELKSFYYNNRGYCYKLIGDLEENQDNKNYYFRNAFENYKKAIEKGENHYIQYLNRGNLYQELSILDKALEDYIMVIILNPNHTSAIQKIKEIFKSNNDLVNEAHDFYSEQCKENKIEKIEVLDEIFQEFKDKMNYDENISY